MIGVWASAIHTGAILTESPLLRDVNPTPFPSPTTRKVAGVSLSADLEIASFAASPTPPSSQETNAGTDELGLTRFTGKTNRSNYADYYKQPESFLPFSSSHALSLFVSTSTTRVPSTSQQQQQLAGLPNNALHFNGRFPPGNGSTPLDVATTLANKLLSATPSSRLPSLSPSLSDAETGSKSEFISAPFLQSSFPVGSAHLFRSPPGKTSATGKRSVEANKDEEQQQKQNQAITAFPDKPQFYSSSPPTPPPSVEVSSEAGTEQSNGNLPAKLWPNTRSGKFNLPDEHQSLLRIESEAVTPSVLQAAVALSLSPLPGASLIFNTEQPQSRKHVRTTSTSESLSGKINSGVYTTTAAVTSTGAGFKGTSHTVAIEVDDEIKNESERKKASSEEKSLSEKSVSLYPSSLSGTTIQPAKGGTPLLTSSVSFDMTSLRPPWNETKPPFSELDHVKERESNQQASLLPVPVTTSNFSSAAPADNMGDSPSQPARKVTDKKDARDEEEATVVATKLAFPFLDNMAGTSEKENLIKLKESSSSSAQPLASGAGDDERGRDGIETRQEQQQQHHLMLYPEWLSSGGVYPDDDTSAQSSGALAVPAYNTGNSSSSGGPGVGGAEYYTEPEYEPLLSGEGSSVARISSHLYNFAVPNRNLPPLPPMPPLTEEEDLRDEEEFKRYARLREKLADELLQDVVAAADARRNWQSDRSGGNRDQMIRLHEQPEGEEVEGMNERESRNIIGPSKLTSNGGGGGDLGVVSTESPQAIIAQQSGLADVISRGRIDSVMYVYFGDKLNDYHTEEIAGRVIQVN